MLGGNNISVLSPKGFIAFEQRQLIMFAVLLSLFVIAPVFLLTIGITWHYRASNKNAKYSPEWDNNRYLEVAWWGIPLIVILILSVVTWRSSHDLDPMRAISVNKKPLTIQVVALQWKWLFIYPEQGIATINQVRFPVDTPLNFELTADAPMNSFWIPELGGQIYAMSGMSTRLHLLATQIGTFRGVSANLSGMGHASMNFTAQASSLDDFERWVADSQQTRQRLDMNAYAHLATPSLNNPVTSYSLLNDNLYQSVINKFGPHTHKLNSSNDGSM
ncbi:ubiquinol oxidase subunit II [Candidatus Saccharibacteria bacterium]|nr:ubiquinol oxidase subunit II [Candidatus Saccharibacteria bacterium]MBI3338046.1 ubiquinol oxidase subunit II [Candidatus Saccharibacteria bacterium]